jgi:hypothetical protein
MGCCANDDDDDDDDDDDMMMSVRLHAPFVLSARKQPSVTTESEA